MGGYPDNQFDLDELEADQYGGQPASRFDQDAWTWITGLLRSISSAVLSHVRQPFTSQVVFVHESVAVGDVLAMDISQDTTDPNSGAAIAYIAKWATINTAGGQPKIVGIALAPAAALAKVQCAVGGYVPARYTTLAPGQTAGLLGVNPTTSKPRAWQSGDDSLGYTTPAGNVYLMFGGRVA